MSHFSGTPQLPSPSTHSIAGFAGWSAAMVRVLTEYLSRMAFNVNQQPHCPEFTVATIPTAADWTGRIIFVSDAAAGANFQASTGAAWVNLG